MLITIAGWCCCTDLLRRRARRRKKIYSRLRITRPGISGAHDKKGDRMKTEKIRKATNHNGSSFDSFLEEEGIREDVEAVAIKRVLAWQLERAMREQQKTKQAMAKQLRTSRSQLDRLLDPQNVSVSLDTITRAARALGKRLIIRVADLKTKRA